LSAVGDTLHPDWPELFTELLVIDAALAAYDAEGQQESGSVLSLNRLQQEWQWDFERFIEQKTIARSRVDPFVPHYSDS
jgi:hypothetical protein